MIDLIYIAGPLNSDAPGYIQNLNNMAQKSIDIRRLGCATICPGNDFIEGLVCGTFNYEDYTKNTLEIMKHCDAVYVMENSHNSKGVKKEIEEAKKHGIPVFYEEKKNRFLQFLKRPKKDKGGENIWTKK